MTDVVREVTRGDREVTRVERRDSPLAQIFYAKMEPSEAAWLAVERYFIACAKSAWRGPGVQALVAVLRSGEFAAEVKQLPGYDASQAGKRHALDDALTWVERGLGGLAGAVGLT